MPFISSDRVPLPLGPLPRIASPCSLSLLIPSAALAGERALGAPGPGLCSRRVYPSELLHTHTNHMARAQRTSLLWALSISLQVRLARGADDAEASRPSASSSSAPLDEAPRSSGAAPQISGTHTHQDAHGRGIAGVPAYRQDGLNCSDEEPWHEEPEEEMAQEELPPPEVGGIEGTAALAAFAAAAAAATTLDGVSRKRRGELVADQRAQVKQHKKERAQLAAAAQRDLAQRVHPRPSEPAAAALPAWISDFDSSHDLYFVGGWAFCQGCGTRHSGKGSPAASGICPRDLHDKSTQSYLTRVLRHGRLPSQLAKAYAGQWPDGMDASANPVRAVRRLQFACGAWSLCYDGAASASL